MEPSSRTIFVRRIQRFSPGICAVCGWHGIVGVVCRNRRCAARYIYDPVNNVVRGKGRIKVSRAQRDLFTEVRDLVKAPTFQEVIFPWSIGTHGAGYRFDIVVPSINLIVEYDSLIHKKYNKFFHKNRAMFNAMVLRDQIKDRMAKRAGWKLIRVKEGSPEGGLIARRYIDQQRTDQ